jgi:hypothetical protein
VVPAPVNFRGAPAVRFWELEDARVDYTLMPVGPTDLPQLLLIEYASSDGNDWYLIPLDLPVGSITRIRSLVVTDTFGVRLLHGRSATERCRGRTGACSRSPTPAAASDRRATSCSSLRR